MLGLGTILLASPFLLWWCIRGSYERYVWITSGPFQLVLYFGSFTAGAVLTSIALVLRSALRDVA